MNSVCLQQMGNTKFDIMSKLESCDPLGLASVLENL